MALQQWTKPSAVRCSTSGRRAGGGSTVRNPAGYLRSASSRRRCGSSRRGRGSTQQRRPRREPRTGAIVVAFGFPSGRPRRGARSTSHRLGSAFARDRLSLSPRDSCGQESSGRGTESSLCTVQSTSAICARDFLPMGAAPWPLSLSRTCLSRCATGTSHIFRHGRRRCVWSCSTRILATLAGCTATPSRTHP